MGEEGRGEQRRSCRGSDRRCVATRQLDIVFLPVRAAWPHLVARGGGSIINFASVAAWGGVKVLPQIAHATGKGGVLAMTRQMAVEGAPHKIRANSLSPGLIVTPATRMAFDAVPGFEEAIREKTLLDRFGEPDDVAYAARYLASDESQWVTGVDIRIDGGATACDDLVARTCTKLHMQTALNQSSLCGKWARKRNPIRIAPSVTRPPQQHFFYEGRDQSLSLAKPPLKSSNSRPMSAAHRLSARAAFFPSSSV
ncbi:SDR family NAD(P)-dependent oxidoreductase [Sphingobium sp. EM0848]|uniref:SDR family NAD(P)-dependent oxidoreductase n=1 Tax=Sphingobium sp. EM0848 TaxID=2743473 RepID=UPI0035101E9F